MRAQYTSESRPMRVELSDPQDPLARQEGGRRGRAGPADGRHDGAEADPEQGGHRGSPGLCGGHSALDLERSATAFLALV